VSGVLAEHVRLRLTVREADRARGRLLIPGDQLAGVARRHLAGDVEVDADAMRFASVARALTEM